MYVAKKYALLILMSIFCFAILGACRPHKGVDIEAAAYASNPRHLRAIGYIEAADSKFEKGFYIEGTNLQEELSFYKDTLSHFNNKNIIKIQKAIISALEKEQEARVELDVIRKKAVAFQEKWLNDSNFKYEDMRRSIENIPRAKALGVHHEARTLAQKAVRLIKVQLNSLKKLKKKEVSEPEEEYLDI